MSGMSTHSHVKTVWNGNFISLSETGHPIFRDTSSFPSLVDSLTGVQRFGRTSPVKKGILLWRPGDDPLPEFMTPIGVAILSRCGVSAIYCRVKNGKILARAGIAKANKRPTFEIPSWQFEARYEGAVEKLRQAFKIPDGRELYHALNKFDHRLQMTYEQAVRQGRLDDVLALRQS